MTGMEIMLAGQAIQGISQAIGGAIGGGKRRREQREARAEYRKRMAEFESMTFENPFASLQNPFEDLTVNQQQAKFLAEQQQQGLANTMNALQGAAGASGIASLAQAMANQQSLNLQKASASIGLQEAKNQQLAAKGALQVELARGKGKQYVQDREFGRTSTQLGMSQQRLTAANMARQQATQQMIGGIGQLAGTAAAFGASQQASPSSNNPFENLQVQEFENLYAPGDGSTSLYGNTTINLGQ